MSKIILPKTKNNHLKQQVIIDRLQHGDVTYANGTKGNNHLDLGYDDIPVGNPLRHRIGVYATSLILESQISPQFIATVPTGADGWGDLIAAMMNVRDLIRIKSKKTDRRVFANTPQSNDLVSTLKSNYEKPHGIVIDDATTDGGTTEAYTDFLSEQGLEVDIALSLFYRGKLQNLNSKYNRAILLDKYIPPMLNWDEFNATGNIIELDTTTSEH